MISPLACLLLLELSMIVLGGGNGGATDSETCLLIAFIFLVKGDLGVLMNSTDSFG